MKLSANSFLRALVGPFESTDLVKSHRKQCSGRQTRVQICMGATDDTYDRIGVYSTLCKEHCGTLATRKPTAAMAASYHAKLDAFNEVNKAVERIIGSADRMAEELAGMSKLRPIAGLPDSVATELQEIIDGAITKLESIDPSALRRYRAGINPGITTPALTPTQSARQRKTSATAKTKLTAPTPRSRVKRPGKTKQSSHKETSRLDKKGKGKEKAHTPAAPTSAGSSVNDELVNAAVPISSDESEGLDESVELTLLKPMGDSEELESAESSIFTAFIYTKAHEDAKKFLFYAPVASCLEFTQYPAPAGRGFNYFSVNSSEYKSADDPISLERRGEYMIYRKHGLRSVECPGIGEYEAQALHSAEKCEAEALKSAGQFSQPNAYASSSRKRLLPPLSLSLSRSYDAQPLTLTLTASPSLSLSVSYHTETPTLTLTLTTRTDDSRSAMDPLLRAALRAPPSPSDKAGTFYMYEIRRRQPNRPVRRAQAKLGRAKDPSKRKLQWFRKCRGQRQRWWCYWRVPFAAKFERLIHLHFKLRGAWLGRQPCDFCPTKHQEKYDLEGCGGRAGVRAAVELYLGLLRWRIVRLASVHSGLKPSVTAPPGAFLLSQILTIPNSAHRSIQRKYRSNCYRAARPTSHSASAALAATLCDLQRARTPLLERKAHRGIEAIGVAAFVRTPRPEPRDIARRGGGGFKGLVPFATFAESARGQAGARRLTLRAVPFCPLPSNSYSSLCLSDSLSYDAQPLTLTLTTRTDDSRSVMHPLLRAALRAPPSPSDKAGTFYMYEIRRRQPNRPVRRAQAKLGRAKDPSKRKLQWFRKCRGQRQRWWCYWRVPFAAKFERLIHVHFKLRGAWLGRQPCDFCPTKHQEKYDLEACGGRAGVRAAVELYLGLLRWRILRVDM
ncbi:hypothetical protein B0H15DRAFT_956134 [Mycena belliarum]|uniref:Bacteriophage T5 Orf172 DNA-binding domain-containing protein n=2 Tax=Mycena belliarum TaxID=1033014 RepID=A0AAD6TT56_9AGAR|nr:hypothetical protein B0H15DRAFT_956134 [Mycena belliae]